jgi:methylthioribulose-1-phosphate dehydratase
MKRKPADFPREADALCDTCRLFGERGWCRATSGNFSARVAGDLCLITRSGCDKSALTADDLLVCGLDGRPADGSARPSAETPLHLMLYALDPSIGAVLHTHSVFATLLSMATDSELTISDFEMQKALTGVTTHEAEIAIPVFANDQDMHALAVRVGQQWRAEGVPGFLIGGHGLYAWGKDVADARRHVEGFEFLFECMWQRRQAGLQ